MGGGRKTGIDALARASGRSPPHGGVYSGFGNERAKPLVFPPGSPRDPASNGTLAGGAKPPDALRARKCASGRPAMREARVPAGQDRKRRPLRSAKRGTECVRNSRSTSPAPDRHPDGPGLQARSAPADRAGRPKGSGQTHRHPPLAFHYNRRQHSALVRLNRRIFEAMSRCRIANTEAQSYCYGIWR